MDPEIKAKWIAALRSGDYSQTESYLRNYHGFCCLGVLCDLIEPEQWREPYLGKTNYRHRSNAEGLPDGETLALAGLTLSNAEELSQMNDMGADFRTIANNIEINL
jgi:hypothetical protein